MAIGVEYFVSLVIDLVELMRFLEVWERMIDLSNSVLESSHDCENANVYVTLYSYDHSNIFV